MNTRKGKQIRVIILAIVLLCCFWLYRQPGREDLVRTASTANPAIEELPAREKKNSGPITVLADLSGISKKDRKHEKTGRRDKEWNEESEENETEGPKLAWEQDFARTMDPVLKRPTPEVLQEVVRQNQSVLFSGKKINGIPGTASSPWVERGPKNVGGRTRSLVWDPNDATKKKVWAGGVTGGLWYNNDITDVNSSWIKIDDFWANLSVSAIVFDPNNPQVAYAGTGEGFYSSSSLGAGIWKTTNGGNTWTQLTSTVNFNYINDLSIRNESGTSVIYAAVDALSYNGTFFNTANAGLRRSADGGTTWTQVLPSIPGTSTNFTPASVVIGANNRLWVGTKACPFSLSDRGGGRILYSDNGTAWTTSDKTTVTNGSGRITIACAPSDANYVYAFIEDNSALHSIKKTTNGGGSWTNTNEPADGDNGIPASDFTRGQAFYDQALEVDPNDPNTVLIGGVDLFRTTNGGTNWTQISKWSNNPGLAGLGCSIVHADQHTIAFKPGSSSTVIFGNDGGVFYSTSISTAGTNDVIAARNNNYNVTQFYFAAMHPTAGNNIFLAGAQDNGTHRFSAGGINATTEVNGGDGGYCFIDQQNPLYQISAYVHNNFYLSTDGGLTFNTTLIADDQTGSFINPACYDNNLHILYTYKAAGSIYRVKNVTTTPLKATVNIAELGGKATAFKVSPYTTNSTTLYIGTDGGNLLKLTNADGTPTVTDIGGPLPFGSISCVETGASENELLVTYFNYGIKKIWYSQDGGNTWVDKSGNYPNIPARWALFNPNNRTNEVILATELGIYATTNFSNANPTWTQVNTGFANVRTDMLQTRSSDNEVIAATFGRGLFSSSGFGNNGVPAPAITSFAPASAAVGATVTITGTNFTGASAVSFGGVAATSYTVVSATTIASVVGGGASGNVSVSTPGGTANKTGFTFVPGPPTISSFSPANAGSGTLVTINGTNLAGTLAVSFGGTVAASFTIVSATSVTATVGTGSSGSISVTTSVGSATSSGFNFFQAPTITAFSPATGGIATSLTITGTNFTGTVGVTIGGTAATAFTVTSSTGITALVGPGSTGDINVTTPGGTGVKTGFVFISGPPPVVSSFSPASGAAGTALTITGINFNPAAANNIVYFGAVRASVNAATATSLSVTVPIGATYQPISVLDKVTGLTGYAGQPFIVTFLTKSSITAQDFDAKVDFNTSTNANGIAIGDIDGDGKADIVVANSNDNTISVYRNISGSGAFTAASLAAKVDFVTGFRPNGVAIGDLDGDGKPDIAVSTYNSTTVTVFRNTAAAGSISASSLAAKIEFNVGFSGTRFIAIGDLDKDGKPDLVIVNNVRNTMSVLRNTSSVGNITAASFLPRVDFTTGSGPGAIAIGDIDGDGKPDIAVANSSITASTASIFRNTSSSGTIAASSFAAKVDISTSVFTPQSVTIGDLDGDGKQDIIVAMYNSGNNINVFRNTGTSGSITTASFAPKVDLSTGQYPNPSCVLLNDMDGDGKPDIVASNGWGNLVSIFRNISTSGLLLSSSFAAKAELTAGNTPYTFAIGDLNGDGRPDIASLNTGAGTLSLYRNDPQYPPAVISFTPTSAASGNRITITGTDLTGATTVTLGGTAVASFTVLSSTTVSAVVGTGSSGNVGVTTPNGTGTLAGFTFIPAPAVTSFVPTSATTGNVISITGTNFTNAISVDFGGTAATGFTVTSATNIVAAVGAGATGNITVITPGGTANRGVFIFLPPPVIASFTPVNAGTGSVITITGTNLTGATAVSFGGTAAASFTVLSSTTIAAVVGAGTTGNVSVTTPVAVATSAGFTYYPAPTITSFSPATAATGEAITITGTNFTGTLAVSFGGTAAAAFTVTSNTTIMAAAGAGSNGAIGVTTYGGTASKTGFIFCTAPIITAGGAISFCTGGTVLLTSNAATGNQWIKDGGTVSGAASSTFSATTSGSYTVSVTSANGCLAASAAIVITVNALPAIPTVTAGGAITFCAGGNTVLSSSAATGNQWYKDGGVITGAAGTTYTATASGVYTVKVTNANNCTASSGATAVTVNALPPVPAISAGGPTSFCSGTSVVLTSNAASGNQWYNSNIAVTGATGTSFTATQTGSYSVIATNASGCTAGSVAIAVTVNPIPAKPTITRSNADLVSSSATGNQWSSDVAIIANATSQNYRPTLSGYYKVAVTAAGCTSQSSDLYYYVITGVFNILGGNIGSYKILPNPATEKLVIQAANANDRINLQMIDPNGRIIVRRDFSGSTTVDMGFFASGMYTVLLTDAKTRKQESKQVVKQ